MKRLGSLGNFALIVMLALLGVGLGAMGGVSVAMNAGWARWPGHAAEVRVVIAQPTWQASQTTHGAVPLAPESLVAAITPEDLSQRWAEVTLRAQADQPGTWPSLDGDLPAVASLLSSALASAPAYHDGAVVLQVRGFRSAAEALQAASAAGEALVGLISDLRAEELLALREGTDNPSSATSIDAALQARDFGVAAATASPVLPRPPLPFILAGGIGGIVGLVLMLIAVRPRTAYTPQLSVLATISQALGVEVIGAIPRSRSLEQADASNLAPKLLDEKGDAAALEAMEVLLTNFRFAAPAKELRRVCFLSVVPGEGCATVALNFAAAHARKGLRVGFIAPGQPRPTEVLPHNLTQLDEMPNAPAHDLDMLVIVGPAVLADPAARNLATQSDAVVLVLDTAITGRELALRALGLLRAVPAPLAGLVLNRVRRAGLRRAFYARAKEREASI